MKEVMGTRIILEHWEPRSLWFMFLRKMPLLDSLMLEEPPFEALERACWGLLMF